MAPVPMAQVEPVYQEEAPRNRRAGDAAASKAAPVLLDRYEIYLDEPLPAYESLVAGCYAASDTKGARESLMALIARHRLPPRADILSSLRSIDCPALIRPYRWAAVDWPGGSERRFAILCGQPGGPRLMPSLSEPIAPMSDDALTQGVIKSLVSALGELSARGITHRAIRPDNIFFKDAALRDVVLGDAAIAPAGSTNPALFETIENGMAHPLGRGPGIIADDLYALGATLLVLSLGINPLADLSEHDVIAAKIDKGSYGALVGTHRISQTLREPIRGLLADDPKERWTLQDLALWLDGRRLSPIQPSLPPQAGRGYSFAGGQYFSCRGLAHAMARQWESVGPALNGHDLEAWISRSVGDAKTAEAVAAVLARGAGEGGGAHSGDGLLAARLCAALDPKGPLRFKMLSTMFEGIGPALCGLMSEPNGAQPFAQLIMSDLPLYWIDKRYGDGPDARPFVKIHDRLRGFMKNQAPGFGAERCVYELNPGLPCLSPVIESRYVADAEGLLPALEEVAGDKNRPSFPIDRHIAAFIATRFRQGTEDHLRELADRGDAAKAALGALRALAVMQWRLGPPQLPQLTAWCGRLVEAVIDGYHGAALRKNLQGLIARAIRKGSLVELLNLVDDKAVRDGDLRAYQRAVSAYAAAEAEIGSFSKKEGAIDRMAEHLANRIALTVSGAVVLGTVAVLMLIRHF